MLQPYKLLTTYEAQDLLPLAERVLTDLEFDIYTMTYISCKHVKDIAMVLETSQPLITYQIKQVLYKLAVAVWIKRHKLEIINQALMYARPQQQVFRQLVAVISNKSLGTCSRSHWLKLTFGRSPIISEALYKLKGLKRR